MKNIWILTTLDGDMYFTNPEKPYDYAKNRLGMRLCAYQTYLKKLREADIYDFTPPDSDDIRCIRKAIVY